MKKTRKRHLLVADDISNPSEDAKRRSQLVRGCAKALATRLGSGIDLVYVENLRSRKAKGKLSGHELARLHEEIRDKVASAARAMECDVDCFIKFGSPAQEILRTARGRARPELIVLGTQGRTGMERVLVGSVAEEVIRHADRPVMVIGPKVHEVPSFEKKGAKAPRILVATEIGRNSRAAEQYALSLARRLGAEVTLYHCLWDSFRMIEENVMNSGIVAEDLDETLAEIRRDAEDTLKERVRYFKDRGISCEYKVENHSVASSQAVYEEAKKGYCSVIMGTHGRNALMTAFFGSTARETILNASVPVITVRSRKS